MDVCSLVWTAVGEFFICSLDTNSTLTVLIFATTSASDEVAPIWWQVAWYCFIFGSVVALFALGASLFSRTAHRALRPRLMAGIAILFSVFPLGFDAYIHHIDFVEVGGDGTRASGPLWRAILFPLLPVMVALLAIGIASVRQRLTLTTALPSPAVGRHQL